MQVPPEFLLFILLLASAVVFAYFYLKRAQLRTPRTTTKTANTQATAPDPVDATTDRTAAEANAARREE